MKQYRPLPPPPSHPYHARPDIAGDGGQPVRVFHPPPRPETVQDIPRSHVDRRADASENIAFPRTAYVVDYDASTHLFLINF